MGLAIAPADAKLEAVVVIRNVDEGREDELVPWYGVSGGR